jgi:hypothetical protein
MMSGNRSGDQDGVHVGCQELFNVLITDEARILRADLGELSSVEVAARCEFAA